MPLSLAYGMKQIFCDSVKLLPVWESLSQETSIFQWNHFILVDADFILTAQTMRWSVKAEQGTH